MSLPFSSRDLGQKLYWTDSNKQWLIFRVGIVGGVHPPPSSCLLTLIFGRKSALNFNPWAKFQTFGS